MKIYPDDGKVINMLDAMNIVKKYKNNRKDRYITKLQEWYSVYSNLGPGWEFSGGCVAIKIE